MTLIGEVKRRYYTRCQRHVYSTRAKDDMASLMVGWKRPQNPTASVVAKKNSTPTGDQSPVVQQKFLTTLSTSLLQ
jgi:hypothetical protein